MYKLLTLSFISVLALNVHAQITITEADLPRAKTFYILGNDTLPSISIGAPDSNSQVWDFSALSADYDKAAAYSNTSETPYAGTFTASNIYTYGPSAMFGTLYGGAPVDTGYDGFTFWSSDSSGLKVIGWRADGGPWADLDVFENPAELLIGTPATYNTTFNNFSIWEMPISNNNPLDIDTFYLSQRTKTLTCDAWGSLTTPFGTFDVLRIHEYVIQVDSAIAKMSGIPLPLFSIELSRDTSNNYIYMTNGIGYPVAIIHADVNNNIKDAEYLSDTLCTLDLLDADIKASCYGMCDGKATVTPSNGTPPYFYLWNDPKAQTTRTAVGLCPGTYNVIIVDIYGCIGTRIITVSESNMITLSLSTVDATCGNADGIATVTVSGGIPPYHYVWSSGDTIETGSSLPAGINYVTVSDSNDCIVYGTVTISDLSGPSISYSTIDLNCNGDTNGSIDITVSGGTAPYTYFWSDGSALEDIGNLTGGIYEVIVNDAPGCIVSASITVAEPEPFSLSFSTMDASCLGMDGSVTVSVTGGTGPYNYLWSPGGGTDTTESGVAAGVYSVAVTDAKGCTNISSVAVNNIGGPVITIDTIINTGCGNPDGGSVDISITDGTPPYTYLWSTSDITEDLSALSDSTYSVIVTDSIGCIGAASIDIKFLPSAKGSICLVTVDSATNKNLIAWEESGTNIVSYNIYREGTKPGGYFFLDNIPYSSTSSFLDTLADPSKRSWRYKITAIDSCGIESELSQLHKTIHLITNLNAVNNINLKWDHYEGFYSGTYYIYRGISPNILDSIGSVDGKLYSYTDSSPPPGLLYYQVAAVHPSGCSTTLKKSYTSFPKGKDYNASKSNTTYSISPGDTTYINQYSFPGSQDQIKVYPNPSFNNTILTVENIPDGSFISSFVLYDLLGNEIIHMDEIKEKRIYISIGNIPSGMYIYNVFGNHKMIGAGKLIINK